MNQKKIKPKYNKIQNPKIGLIALASDYIIEKDFLNITHNRKIDLFVNRIKCYNPLTKKNLIKMSRKITSVAKDILPGEKINCVAYACTSGTIAAGFKNIENKIKKAKSTTKVTTPSTSSLKALKKMKIKKIAIFTPYTKKLNDEVVEYFTKNKFIVTSNLYFGIASDIYIGKVNKEYLLNILSKMKLNGADALFISCTALPALSIIERLEKKLHKPVLSSNQTLIWDTLNSIGVNKKLKGYGSLFKN